MSDETVDQFVLKPRQRAMSCDFGVLEDDYIRDQVIDKCYSSHLRAKVLFLLVKPIVFLFVCFLLLAAVASSDLKVPIVSQYCSFTKVLRARESFIFYFPNQKRRNYR